MGFFSQECHGCHMSILAPYNLWGQGRGGRPVNLSWMNHFVAVQKDGKLHSGAYDGYGRTEVADERDERTEADWDAIEGDMTGQLDRSIGPTWDERGNETHSGPTVWHEACWLAAGSPRDWKGESPGASDQGYFYDLDDYATARPPKSPAGLAKLAARGTKLEERRRRELEHEMAQYKGGNK